MPGSLLNPTVSNKRMRSPLPDTTSGILDQLLRLDSVRDKDLYQIAGVALQTLLEVCGTSGAVLGITLDCEPHSLFAELDAAKAEPLFTTSSATFADLVAEKEGYVVSKRKEEGFCVWCRITDTGAANVQEVLDGFLVRVSGAVAYYLLRQELQKNTNEMHRLRLNLEYSFNSIPDAIVTVSEDMRILTANKAFLATYGGLLSDYKGKSLGECFGETATPYESVVRQTLQLGRITSNFQITTKTPDGEPCRLELNAAPLRTGDYSFGGAVLVIKDLTRLAILEQQLEDRRLLTNMVGKSEAMQHVASLVRSLADIETTVLITGESGTGKELVAEALHYTGSRAEKKIVKVNCAALSESLLETELFGHVRGAFTGAVRDSKGRVAAAEGGTLFLDEIGDLPLSIQLKLLRFLEYKQYEQVGSSRTHTANVRVVTATNADLLQKVREGSFRKDLYYRLNVFQIELPPLRERREDIPLLIRSFLTAFNNELGRSIESVCSELMDIFMQHEWPGNVRELRHCIEYAVILCPGTMLMPIHLPSYFRDNVSCCPSSIPTNALPPKPARASSPAVHPSTTKPSRLNAETIRAALTQANGKKAGAARILGISRPTLYRWMRQTGITSS